MGDSLPVRLVMRIKAPFAKLFVRHLFCRPHGQTNIISWNVAPEVKEDFFNKLSHKIIPKATSHIIRSHRDALLDKENTVSCISTFAVPLAT